MASLDPNQIFFFTAGEERDGALERGTGVGLEREMVHRRGLGSGNIIAAAGGRDKGEGEKRRSGAMVGGG
jgi:hypothetical protein